MQLQDYQNWGREFYQRQGWYQYGPFIRVNFLSEEIGEVARAVRAIEIGRDRPDETEASFEVKKACLAEELGDVLDNLFVLADKYGIDMEEVVAKHQAKFIRRYGAQK